MDGRSPAGRVEPDSSATLGRAPPLGEDRSTTIHRRAAFRAYRRADKRRNPRFPFTTQGLRQASPPLLYPIPLTLQSTKAPRQKGTAAVVWSIDVVH